MAEMEIRKEGRAGRMTFNRVKALNALNHAMVGDIHAALDRWRDDPDVDLVIIDANGEKAFCAGGDIAAVYRAGLDGDHSIGRQFFFDEYRMNAAIKDYPKPIIAFMQGFVMGGGVGVGGHASHRIVGESTRIAMPESGIGLIPDVGGSWLLGKAPGHIGEYLMMTSDRMDAGDALYAGFADFHIPEDQWPELARRLVETGDASIIAGQDAPDSRLAATDLSAFGADSVAEITAQLEALDADEMLKPIRRNSPLSMAAGLRLVRAARDDSRLQDSLAREYRFTYRATQDGDFIEGVRAQIIDKDRNPQWSADASDKAVEAMLAPLGAEELRFDQ